MLNNTEPNGRAEYMEDRTTPASPRHGDPLVSAIMTTHNREPDMVLRAVYSVLNQTHQNMELIVVDDSSPSFARRAEVEQSVRSVSDDILYLKHEVCQGPCAARNTGLRHAKGTYVGFLDDDDEWMPTKVEEQLRGFHDENTEKLLRFNFIGPTSGPLIKKECIDAVGGFDVLMESSQDYDLWLRLAMKYPIQYIDIPLLRCHIHSGKRIMTDDEKRIRGVERILSKYAEYFNADRNAWYSRGIILMPHYLNVFGRKKALALWFSCVKKCPEKISYNFKLLATIIIGHEQ